MRNLKFNPDKDMKELFDMNKVWQEEEERWNNYHKELGNYIGYDSKDCISCGRGRVNVFDNGNKVCEKCGTDQKTGEGYYNEYGSWSEFDV